MVAKETSERPQKFLSERIDRIEDMQKMRISIEDIDEGKTFPRNFI